MPQLTYYQKTEIVVYKQIGYKSSEISEKTGVQRRTINRVFKKFEQEGAVERKQGSGRPHKFDDRGIRNLINVVKKEKRLSLQQIASLITEEACLNTVRAALHEEGFFNRSAKRKPFLNNSHQMRRLKFAKEDSHWDVDMWKKIIWTDESSFEIGKQNGTIRVWRRVGETYKKECLAGTQKSGRSSLMVWGAIRFGEKSELVFMSPERKGVDLVRNVYKQSLLRFWNHKPDLILMEDDAPIHRCAEAKNWKREQAIESLE
ncbi:hypothetical protein G6F56_007027 [Rhizopus delemar]|nr:hypothetical protein G6F56_007027 [Rhizopus delemar]